MGFPSVTTVLGPWQNFANVRPDILEAAQERGSRVHKICAALSLGLWVPEIPPECRPYIDSFLGWLPVVERIVAVEPELVCPKFRFKGHPDLICIIRGDNGNTLIDLKSPRALSASWRLQIAAYRHLAAEKYPPINRVASLRLSPDGKRAKLEEYTGTVNYDFAVFLACLTAYKFFRKE